MDHVRISHKLFFVVYITNAFVSPFFYSILHYITYMQYMWFLMIASSAYVLYKVVEKGNDECQRRGF